MCPRQIRHQCYLPEDLSQRFDARVAAAGASKASVIADAVSAWLDRREASGLEVSFGHRIGGAVQRLEQIEHQMAYTIELLGVFMQHQLTLNAGQLAFTTEAQSVGLERFRRLLDLADARLAGTAGSSLAARAGRRAENANDAGDEAE